MRRLRLATVVAAFAVIGGYADADPPEYMPAPQSPHVVTYSKTSVSPGQTVTINGRLFVAQRVPLIDYLGGRYAVTYLGGDCLPPYERCVYTSVSYYHTTESFTPELTIDGYPAKIGIYELREPAVGRSDPAGTWATTTETSVRNYVTIDVGDVHLVFQFDIYAYTPVTSLTTPNAVPTTQWWTLEEDVEPLRTFDWWIDYIRIYKFP